MTKCNNWCQSSSLARPTSCSAHALWAFLWASTHSHLALGLSIHVPVEMHHHRTLTCISPSGFIDDNLVRTSGKLELLNRILPEFFVTDHRVS